MEDKNRGMTYTFTDELTTLASLKKIAHETFDIERDWAQFHSLKNLSMNISAEAAELMEHFLWITTQESDEILKNTDKRAHIEHELADVLIGVVQFANRAGIDLSAVFKVKIALIQEKYPIEKAKGNNAKYTAYTDSKST